MDHHQLSCQHIRPQERPALPTTRIVQTNGNVEGVVAATAAGAAAGAVEATVAAGAANITTSTGATATIALRSVKTRNSGANCDVACSAGWA